MVSNVGDKQTRPRFLASANILILSQWFHKIRVFELDPLDLKRIGDQ